MQKGICKQCNQEKYIVNSKQLCDDCNYFRLHGQTRFEASVEKQKNKVNKIYVINKKPLKTRSKTIKKKIRKPTGERQVHFEIWKEREHICVNCKCDLDRFVDEETGDPFPMLFSHIRSKGARPDLRLDKDNFDLLCPECHFAYEHIGKEAFKKRKTN